MSNMVLVVIDLQNDITKNYKKMIGRVNEAIDWAVSSGMRIVYIKHYNLSEKTRTFKPGTKGAELVPELKVVSDHVFEKSKASALTCEAFAGFIEENGIDTFYITGGDATKCYSEKKCKEAVRIIRKTQAWFTPVPRDRSTRGSGYTPRPSPP